MSHFRISINIFWIRSRYGYIGDGRRGMLTLKNEVLDKVMLRRTKKEKQKEIKLPALTITVSKLKLSTVERSWMYLQADQVQVQCICEQRNGAAQFAHIFELLDCVKLWIILTWSYIETRTTRSVPYRHNLRVVVMFAESVSRISIWTRRNVLWVDVSIFSIVVVWCLTQRRSVVRMRRRKARRRNRKRFEVSRCWTRRVLRAINHFKSQWTYEVWRETRTRKLRRVLCAWIDLVMSCYFLVVTRIFVNNA